MRKIVEPKFNQKWNVPKLASCSKSWQCWHPNVDIQRVNVAWVCSRRTQNTCLTTNPEKRNSKHCADCRKICIPLPVQRGASSFKWPKLKDLNKQITKKHDFHLHFLQLKCCRFWSQLSVCNPPLLPVNEAFPPIGTRAVTLWGVVKQVKAKPVVWQWCDAQYLSSTTSKSIMSNLLAFDR